jgi:hypothetical protein
VANILLAWRNRIDEATLSGGLWQATLPLNNIKNRQIQKVARTVNINTTSTLFVADLTQGRSIGVLALAGHNISETGRVRVMGHTADSWSSPTYDSGWIDAWAPGIVPIELQAWEMNEYWTGSLTAEFRNSYRNPFIHVLPAEQFLRYWRVEIDDTVTRTYVEIGRVFLGQAWQPAVNYEYGAELGFEDPSIVETSLSGAEYFDERPSFRVLRFTLAGMSQYEGQAFALDLQRVAGSTGEVLVVPDADDYRSILTGAFLGRIRRLAALQARNIDRTSAVFEIKESL